jgi:hypothetical protein
MKNIFSNVKHPVFDGIAAEIIALHSIFVLMFALEYAPEKILYGV